MLLNFNQIPLLYGGAMLFPKETVPDFACCSKLVLLRIWSRSSLPLSTLMILLSTHATWHAVSALIVKPCFWKFPWTLLLLLPLCFISGDCSFKKKSVFFFKCPLHTNLYSQFCLQIWVLWVVFVNAPHCGMECVSKHFWGLFLILISCVRDTWGWFFV